MFILIWQAGRSVGRVGTSQRLERADQRRRGKRSRSWRFIIIFHYYTRFKCTNSSGSSCLVSCEGLRNISCSSQVYNRELEIEYNSFEDWLHTFNLFRGKCSDDADVEQNAADEDRLIGKFKVCCWDIFSEMENITFIGSGNPIRSGSTCWCLKAETII